MFSKPVRHIGTSKQRSGLTLFEILISLAIFFGSIAVLGQLIANGVRSALRMRLQSEAVQIAEEKLGELVAGIIPFKAVSSSDVEGHEEFTWTLAINQSAQADLFQVEIEVVHEANNAAGEMDYKLFRLMRDPYLFVEALEQAESEAMEEEAESTSP